MQGQLLLNHKFDEVAVEDKLIGVVELVVYSEEIDDFVDLLIVHCNYKQRILNSENIIKLSF